MKLITTSVLIFVAMFVGYQAVAATADDTAVVQQPGKVFHDCIDCPEMVVIPSGTFMMGSPPDEVGRYEEEGPVHRVSIKSLAVGKFDVTLGQWEVFVKEAKRPIVGGCAWGGLASAGANPNMLDPAASWHDHGYEQTDTHPVVCITFDDAQDYTRWLSQRTGHHYRLLSEAEWEYAARAGTTTAFPWGNKATRADANYGPDTGAGVGIASGHDQWVHASPSGSFPPNAFGLYDMNGNVLQMVKDCFSSSYTGLPTDGSAYEKDVTLNISGELSHLNGTRSCAYRMVRGGDWGDSPRMIRSASRNWLPGLNATLQNYRSAGMGFRVARVLD